MNSDIRYSLFDQREKLGEPPWSGPALEAWEKAHGHDARLKCYPEFGCQVLEDQRQRIEKAAREVVAWPYHSMGAQMPGFLDFQAALDRLRDALDD